MNLFTFIFYSAKIIYQDGEINDATDEELVALPMDGIKRKFLPLLITGMSMNYIVEGTQQGMEYFYRGSWIL